MELNQNERIRIIDALETGKISADEANVEMVRCQRVRLIVSPIPRDVRKALNNAVKAGILGHKAKSGNKPEAYFHPRFECLANAERNEHERTVKRALLGICG